MPAGISNGGNVIFVEYTLVFSKMDSLPGEVQRIERIGYENEKNLIICNLYCRNADCGRDDYFCDFRSRQ